MKVLLITGALAMALVGCTTQPQLALDECADPKGFACADKMPVGPQLERKSETLKPDAARKTARSAPSAKNENRSFGQINNGSDSAAKKAKAAVAAKAAPASPAQPADKSDSIINQAKTATAAKMEVPASVEFVEMKGAIRKNTLGESIDTVCGHLRGKTATGEDTGERPFIYIVKENEAYVVGDRNDLAAAAAYQNICN
jgi:hypothetical protein